MSKDLLEQLINSENEESREFLSLLLNAEHIPEAEREIYIKKLLQDYLYNDNKLTEVMKENLIKAYNNLSSNNIKDRIKKI